ncbi:hypothetical protein EYC80_008810 [Monilinia laxa]|uniref:Uncharacterized protein n=1 Tax=Monilinia laxa TaxID=61186 RepID=A0A5N6K1T5_MONLA|nr:hypothetical protein EYC80_008810 [Monilinia laxa]
MNSNSPIDTIQDGTNEAAPEWSHQNGDTIIPIEKKLDNSTDFLTRPLIGKRKAKRKDDSPLDIICRFVVDHQTGSIPLPDSVSRFLPLTMNSRTICQPFNASFFNAHLLSKSSQAHSQIL